MSYPEDKQIVNSFVIISSENRRSGQLVSSFNTVATPQSHNLFAISPVSVDGQIYLQTINSRNNTFTMFAGVPALITLTPGIYASGSAMSGEIQTQLVTAFGGGSFTVTDTTSLNTASRFLITSTIGAFQITAINQYLNRPTGLYVMPAPAAVSFQFQYCSLAPTAYYDVVAKELHRGVTADDSGNGSVSGVLFRINPLPIPYIISNIVTLQQSYTKKLYFPINTQWPSVTWELLDEWGIPIIVEDGSIWWIILATEYYIKAQAYEISTF